MRTGQVSSQVPTILFPPRVRSIQTHIHDAGCTDLALPHPAAPFAPQAGPTCGKPPQRMPWWRVASRTWAVVCRGKMGGRFFLCLARDEKRASGELGCAALECAALNLILAILSGQRTPLLGGGPSSFPTFARRCCGTLQFEAATATPLRGGAFSFWSF